jgi:hypothetical protein
MAAPEPTAPYQLVYSDAVKQRLRELSDAAFARGDGPAFTAALKEFDRLLRLYPQFGDPLSDLQVGAGQVRLGIIRPISMRYGVNEDKRIVFCATLPVLLPMDKPDASAGAGGDRPRE